MDNLYTEAFALDGHKLWYSAMQCNMLYCLDLKTSQNRFVDVFPEIYYRHARLHCRAIKMKDKIYFMPDSGGWIHVFSLQTETIQSIEIQDVESDTRFMDAVEHKGKIYLFNNGDELKIYCLDAVSEVCKPLKVLSDVIPGRLMKYPVKIGAKVYLACSEGPQVVVFDCAAHKIETIALNDCRDGIGTIAYDGHTFWSSTKKGFIQWNREGKVLCRINGFPEGFKTWKITEDGRVEMEDGYFDGGKNREFPFWLSLINDDKLYFFSRMTNMNAVIDLKKGKVEKQILPDEEESECTLLQQKRITCNHYFGEKIGEKMYISSSCSGKFYVISSKGIKEYILNRDREDELACFKQRGSNFKSRIYWENDEVTLSKYMMHLCQENVSMRDDSVEDHGNEIYQIIKEDGE